MRPPAAPAPALGLNMFGQRLRQGHALVNHLHETSVPQPTVRVNFPEGHNMVLGAAPNFGHLTQLRADQA